VDPVALQLMLDHLAGLSGGSAEQQQCAEVVRVVIAGESSKPIAPPVAKAGKKVCALSSTLPHHPIQRRGICDE
jgi:hypothetical protein